MAPSSRWTVIRFYSIGFLIRSGVRDYASTRSMPCNMLCVSSALCLKLSSLAVKLHHGREFRRGQNILSILRWAAIVSLWSFLLSIALLKSEIHVVEQFRDKPLPKFSAIYAFPYFLHHNLFKWGFKLSSLQADCSASNQSFLENKRILFLVVLLPFIELAFVSVSTKNISSDVSLWKILYRRR